MNKSFSESLPVDWKVEKIAVIGPGIVGMPVAALLARARIRIGTDRPARVIIVQRNSRTSGWKVDAINSGRSVIGGVEPELDEIVQEAVSEGLLSATHDYRELADADVILLCVQTDKKGFEPDYGPMFGALTALAEALHKRPPGKTPLLIFESTLAPSSMATVIKQHFSRFGLIEGRDILLGNSPNRVMPGRLVSQVRTSDKLVAGLRPGTPRMIKAIYRHIVTGGELHVTNSLTAEVTKTLENAYRDVRIAYSSEIARYCDEHDISFYAVRDQVNERLSQIDDASRDPNAVPSGGMLVPMLGVGGHCLPKDGILLWWRCLESGRDVSQSLILQSRIVNDASPGETIRLAERKYGEIKGKRVTVMGASYRFNSDDTRNAPSLDLALRLKKMDCQITIYDPYVKPADQNLLKFQLEKDFTNNLAEATEGAEYFFFGAAHKLFRDEKNSILENSPDLIGIVDGCNLYDRQEIESLGYGYTGIGRGEKAPEKAFVDFVLDGFRAVEQGIANEVAMLVDFLNERYAEDAFNRADLRKIQRLAASCNTGCKIVEPGPAGQAPEYRGFISRLVNCAVNGFSYTQPI